MGKKILYDNIFKTRIDDSEENNSSSTSTDDDNSSEPSVKLEGHKK